MSAESIARWNAIPMVRDEVDNSSRPSSMKRTRDQAQEGDGDESDDDVSLVSRSPSPSRADAMEIDKYDEYNQKPELEIITVETKIKSTNKGFAMLAKLGWVEGQPLGLSGDGRIDPVPFVLKNDFTGLGKTNQDVKMIESTVAQRRELDSERQTRETEAQRRAREESVAKREAVRSEISTVLKAFYCELCDKQFQTVGQYDEHTNSYAHHHKARFRDMQAAQKASFGTQEEIDKRKEKERKREEKELRKLAKAAGIKMAKPPTTLSATVAPVVPVEVVSAPSDSKPPGFKKSGWATVGAPSSTPSPPPSTPPAFAGPSRSGWNTVDPVPNPSCITSGRGTISDTPTHPGPPTSSSTSTGAAPAFRTGGWTSLDTGSTVPPMPAVPEQASPPPPAPTDLSGPPLPAQQGWARVATPSSAGLNTSTQPVSRTMQPPKPPQPAQPAVRQEASRSGWQQFKTGGSSSRRR